MNSLGFALGIGLFVAGFLLIFRPFGLSVAGSHDPAFWLILGLAPYNMVLVLLLDRPITWLQKRWTFFTGRMASLLTTVTLIIAGNVAYQAVFQELDHWTDLLEMIWQVAMIAAFPTLFVFLYYRERNPKTHEEGAISTPKAGPVHLQDESLRETLSLNIEDILYIEADRNYALIHTRVSQQPHLLRTSLKALEKQLSNTPIKRCHRSYLVNVTQIIHSRKTARRIQLTLRDHTSKIPVSPQFMNTLADIVPGP